MRGARDDAAAGPPYGAPMRILAVALLLSLPIAQALAAPQKASQRASSPQGGAAAQLDALLEAEWADRLAANPLLASSVGEHAYDHLLPDVSARAQELRAERTRGFLAELAKIDADELDVERRVSRSMLSAQLFDRVLSHEYREWQTPLNADSGFHTSFARLPDSTRLESERDVRNYLARCRAFPVYMDQQIANMRAGMKEGRVLPKVVMLGLPAQLRSVMVDAEVHPFVRAVENLPDTIAEETREQLRTEAVEVVTESILPPFRRFLDFLTNEYVPAGRDELGASHLPDGDEYYAFLVRRYTTLPRTPDQVHRQGLEEVARIRADMEALVESLEFEGSFADFLAFLRSDPRFYARDADELLSRAARICKDVDGLLPRYFNLLPRQPYGVEPVPDSIAPKYTSGRYVRGAPGSGRAGTYWVNTYALESRPLYALPALSLHEAVPGHHLQIALTAELEQLPPFRRNSYVTAFGEGWALYTEWLGIEMGIYDDPYEEFGRMTYEMWRAARLVVDTGIHSKGWTRDQAIEFLASNTALSIHECTTEVDRYISWPGQALAYKTGELEIRALRAECEERLGADFDLRAFHDAVLGSGALPLAVLRERMETWTP